MDFQRGICVTFHCGQLEAGFELVWSCGQKPSNCQSLGRQAWTRTFYTKFGTIAQHLTRLSDSFCQGIISATFTASNLR